MKFAKKKKVAAPKKENKTAKSKTAAKNTAAKIIPAPRPKAKALIKIAAKIRGKVLNIKAVEAAKIPAPVAKQNKKPRAICRNLKSKKPKSGLWALAAAAETLFPKLPTG